MGHFFVLFAELVFEVVDFSEFVFDFFFFEVELLPEGVDFFLDVFLQRCELLLVFVDIGQVRLGVLQARLEPINLFVETFNLRVVVLPLLLEILLHLVDVPPILDLHAK